LYKFSGKELDEEIGLEWYYFGARYYDPEIGRFLSVDPHARSYPSLTPYHYVENNPLRYIDRTGMDGEDPQLPPSPYPYTEMITVEAERINSYASIGFLGTLGTAAVVEPTFVGELIFGGILLYGLVKSADNINDMLSESETDRDIDDVNDADEFPENPDEWNPPEDVKEEIKTKDSSGGKHRQWKDKNGKIVRRWDRSGREAGKERGSHWHNSKNQKVKPGGGLLQ